MKLDGTNLINTGYLPILNMDKLRWVDDHGLIIDKKEQFQIMIRNKMLKTVRTVAWM